jgi:nucleotide-binding universal stress UspA family protein
MSVIVVGVDFTPCSGSALPQAIRIAAWSRATGQAVHVIEPLVARDLEEALGPFQVDVRAQIIQDAGRTWKESTAGIPGVSGLERDVEIDHPVSAILRRVRERSAALLILGTHGAAPADRAAGTLARACVRTAMRRIRADNSGSRGGAPSIP